MKMFRFIRHKNNQQLDISEFTYHFWRFTFLIPSKIIHLSFTTSSEEINGWIWNKREAVFTRFCKIKHSGRCRRESSWLCTKNRINVYKFCLFQYITNILKLYFFRKFIFKKYPDFRLKLHETKMTKYHIKIN